MNINKKNIGFLKKNIFKVKEFNQFNLLFKQLENIEKKAPRPLAIIERAYIYNGASIFSICFNDQKNILPIDFRPNSANNRQGFQKSFLEKIKGSFINTQDQVIDCRKELVLKIKTNKKVKSIWIPNVVHHARDFSGLVAKLLRRFKKIKRVYIFDSYIRENHQNPDDFCRYTPSALAEIMAKHGFDLKKTEEIGNVFDCILYFISQAKEVLKIRQNRDISKKISRLIPALRKKRTQKKYRFLGRKFASASTAYALEFRKTSDFR